MDKKEEGIIFLDQKEVSTLLDCIEEKLKHHARHYAETPFPYDDFEQTTEPERMLLIKLTRYQKTFRG